MQSLRVALDRFSATELERGIRDAPTSFTFQCPATEPEKLAFRGLLATLLRHQGAADFAQRTLIALADAERARTADDRPW
jgi:hypothetical protein